MPFTQFYIVETATLLELNILLSVLTWTRPDPWNDHPNILDMHHDLMSVQYLPVSSPASLCPFCCRTKGENNEGGRCFVWPDNVKVFKGGNEEVSVLTCEGGPLSTLALSVHSNPCSAAQHSDRAAVTACRPMADLHTPSVPKQADVSLCQPPWSDALLRQLKAAQGHSCVHRWSLNYKQRPNRRHPATLRKADEKFLPNWPKVMHLCLFGTIDTV